MVSESFARNKGQIYENNLDRNSGFRGKSHRKSPQRQGIVFSDYPKEYGSHKSSSITTDKEKRGRSSLINSVVSLKPPVRDEGGRHDPGVL